MQNAKEDPVCVGCLAYFNRSSKLLSRGIGNCRNRRKFAYGILEVTRKRYIHIYALWPGYGYHGTCGIIMDQVIVNYLTLHLNGYEVNRRLIGNQLDIMLTVARLSAFRRHRSPFCLHRKN